MLRVVFAVSLVSMASLPASAQSVETWQPREPGFSSVDVITCSTCPQKRQTQAEAELIELQAQGARIFQEDGVEKVARTDNMLGGTPVVTVTSADLLYGAQRPMTASASPEAMEESDVEIIAPDFSAPRAALDIPAQGIDMDAQTSSLSGSMSVNTFELRLN
ncbi:plant virulence effector HPE1-like domain-containing protein [Rhizobium sp. EC-SD404]|uniref:plant virulence effector HPE1-like domain-containing protein n=1 Tax=Rhizobium sp. EC-SD404 TaxID=2038389 RepID=UPI0012544694|nr:plant virulence effector HPE1-like domain-containing protein [Rhizobium sp. EC-SD404]VVT27381.1 conserved exported hypothetical protein [Rhizobium sp. EC-SD404]